MLMSVDFVFRDFHELTVCYRGLGWNLGSRRVLTRPGTDQRFVEATFTRESGDRAYLLFASFNASGENVAPPDSGFGSGLEARLLKAGEGVPGGVYQTQALIQSRNEMTTETQNAVRAAYFQFYDRMTGVAKGGK